VNDSSASTETLSIHGISGATVLRCSKTVRHGTCTSEQVVRVGHQCRPARSESGWLNKRWRDALCRLYPERIAQTSFTTGGLRT
jgi:predicted flavoprotein YhiN